MLPPYGYTRNFQGILHTPDGRPAAEFRDRAEYEQTQKRVTAVMAGTRAGAAMGLIDAIFESPKADAGKKVISAKQLAANRRNALKSTGPKTAAGKARSRLNASQHGLYAVLPLLPGDDPDELRRLAEGFERDYGDRDAATRAVAESTANLLWRSRRLRRAEVTIADQKFLAAERQRLRDKHDRAGDDWDRPSVTSAELLAAEYAGDDAGRTGKHTPPVDRRLRKIADEQLRIHDRMIRSQRALQEKKGTGRRRDGEDGCGETDIDPLARDADADRKEREARQRWIDRRALVFTDPDVAASIIPPGFELDPDHFDWKAWETQRDALLAAGIFPPGARLPGDPSYQAEEAPAEESPADDEPPRWDLAGQPSDETILAEVAAAELEPAPEPIWRICPDCGGRCPPDECANEHFIGPLAPDKVVCPIRLGDQTLLPDVGPLLALVLLLCGWLVMAAALGGRAGNEPRTLVDRSTQDCGASAWHGQAYSLARGDRQPTFATGNGVPLPMPPSARDIEWIGSSELRHSLGLELGGMGMYSYPCHPCHPRNPNLCSALELTRS